MFDILKKKLTGFIDKLTKKEEKKVEETKTEPQQIKTDSQHQKVDHKISNPPLVTETDSTIKIKGPKIESERAIEKIIKPEIPVQAVVKKEKPKEPRKVPEKAAKKQEVNVGILSQIKGIVTGQVELNKNDIKNMLESLEIEMLESDVSLEVAEEIIKELEQKLSGQKVKTGEVNSFVKDKIFETLIGIVDSKNVDILEMAKSTKPLKIMFIGVNGAGKTTTIAKIANMLIKNGLKVATASADTFRAAAIEQMQIHADRLGIKNIKRDYGSDPTAVAFDAVNYSKAHQVDVLLIDTAGRQDTNFNLLNELKKMNRIIQPDLKMYIGESISGGAIISQVSEFKKEIGIDAVILTKLDCDAKGGSVLSIKKMTDTPIAYICTGQAYDDIEKFESKKIIQRILE